jgi:hypothetical protein
MSTTHRQERRLPIPAAWPVRSGAAARPWAIMSAGLAPILLTGAYVIAGVLQPASYRPVSTTISVMAGQGGSDRWVMTAGIFLTGGCYLVTAAGLTGIRASARALLIVAGLTGIGIAASPEPARGSTPRHLGLTVLGAVTIAVWPAFAARRASPRPPILGVYGSAAVTAVFLALLGWLVVETRDGSVLGLAERLTSSIETCGPFIVAVALRRTPLPSRPGRRRERRAEGRAPRGLVPVAAVTTDDGRTRQKKAGGMERRQPGVNAVQENRGFAFRRFTGGLGNGSASTVELSRPSGIRRLRTISRPPREPSTRQSSSMTGTSKLTGGEPFTSLSSAAVYARDAKPPMAGSSGDFRPDANVGR